MEQHRTALVTGAAAGIGRACALRLAAMGHAVGVLDLERDASQKVVDEIVAAGGKALALGGNIADRPSVNAALNELRAAFGAITVTINNAGISTFVDFLEITDEEWDKMFEINTKGTFIVTQLVVPDMKEAAWGRIINISSSSAQTGSADQFHYSASKGAMVAMTRSLAKALGPFGITVNNIPPGSVMNTVMSEANKHRFPISMADLQKMIPVGRTGEPEDIANACAFLASEASSYVTGQTLGVNGGRVPS